MPLESSYFVKRSLPRRMATFSAPLVAANLLQYFYQFVDMAIVGHAAIFVEHVSIRQVQTSLDGGTNGRYASIERNGPQRTVHHRRRWKGMPRHHPRKEHGGRGFGAKAAEAPARACKTWRVRGMVSQSARYLEIASRSSSVSCTPYVPSISRISWFHCPSSKDHPSNS